MHHYATYGLPLSSSLLLPELQKREEPTPAEVTVRVGSLDCMPTSATTAGLRYRVTPREVCLCQESLGAFLVRQGREITVDPAPGADHSAIRAFLLGPVFGVLLHQRGLLVLHASAMDLGGQGVAFMGSSGAGKSTLAAALQNRGHRAVADDVTAVESDTDQPRLVPGVPRLRLLRDAAIHLGCEQSAAMPIAHGREKIFYGSTQSFGGAPCPLRRIYVLVDGQVPEIEAIPASEAMIEILRHSCGLQLFQKARDPAHFLRCAKLVSSVPVRRIKRPRSLALLPRLTAMVEEDL